MIEAAIGIDIGGTNTAYGIVDRNGKVLKEASVERKDYGSAGDFAERLSAGINALISELGDKVETKGLGIGAPNGNYYKGTIEFAPNLPWKGVVNFVELFKKHFDFPVILTNDAKAAAIGEMIYGAAKGMKDFILITLGTGLGSGFVANGEIIYGHDGFAGELGHVIAVRGGRLCGCGRYGCLEQYASATGIVKTVIESLGNSEEKSVLRNIELSSLTSKKIFEAAKAGDKIALEAFDYTGKILGRALADAVAITGPEAIILFGGLALSGEYILKPAKKYLEESLLEVYRGTVKLALSAISGENAAILGASSLVWKALGEK